MPIDHNNILIELNKTVKALNFYPKGHPVLKAQLEHFNSILKQAVTEQGAIKWNVDQKGFYLEEKPIATTQEGIAALAKQFFLRRIRVVTFRPNTTIYDIIGFASLLSMEPQDILSEDGAEKILAKKGVTGVLLNEMSYEELKNLQEEMKEEEEETEQIIMEEEEEQEEEQEESIEEITAGAGDKVPPKREVLSGEEETLEELLERLKKETDTLRYNDLAVRIKERAEVVIFEEHFDDAFPVLVVLSEHGLPASGLPEELRDTASEKLKELISAETINYLIRRLAGREEPERQKIALILSYTGDEAVGLLLDALVGEREAHARRQIYNTLVKFGERIRGELEKRLADERWYAVRQIVSLLGALGGTESLDALEAAYTHPDIRVKKEVFKSLARIPSKRSSKILMEALKDSNRSIQGQAIISLGMLKDPDAVNALGELALQRDTFSDYFEQRKEAVKALGITGDKNAVPYLTELLFKKVWLGKKNHEEMRSLAVIALGKIGGDEALEAIERTCEESAGALYSTCKKVLEGIKLG